MCAQGTLGCTIPAKAGTHASTVGEAKKWAPACAGVELRIYLSSQNGGGR